MALIDELLLTDREIYPSQELIFSMIGDKKICWEKIMNYSQNHYDNISGDWRFYNDGKRWLFKLSRKAKTILWIGLVKGTFRVTFYFGEKAEPVITGSTLPQKIKKDFLQAKRYGKLRAITVKVSGDEDVDNICKLIDIKAKLK